MSREDYIFKAMQHLDNDQEYHRLDEDSTEEFANEISLFLRDMRSCQVIDEETMRGLLPKDPRASRFYILPKIHKPGCPERPIASSCGAPMERISHFVDLHLGPLVRDIPSYIKDTTDFLQKLQTVGDLPADALLVTLDVKSLCINIPLEDG